MVDDVPRRYVVLVARSFALRLSAARQQNKKVQQDYFTQLMDRRDDRIDREARASAEAAKQAE